MTAPAIHDLAQDSGSLPLAATGTTGVAVAGWGYALPVRRVTNDLLAQTLDTSDAWIAERTGIRERRVSGAGESTAPLAVAITAGFRLPLTSIALGVERAPIAGWSMGGVAAAPHSTGPALRPPRSTSSSWPPAPPSA